MAPVKQSLRLKLEVTTIHQQLAHLVLLHELASAGKLRAGFAFEDPLHQILAKLHVTWVVLHNCLIHDKGILLHDTGFVNCNIQMSRDSLRLGMQNSQNGSKAN